MDWKLCPSALIRVGIDCDRHGQGYEYTVLLVIPWWQWMRHLVGLPAIGIVEGMVSPKAMPATDAHKYAITSIIKREGYRPRWDRFQDGKLRQKRN